MERQVYYNVSTNTDEQTTWRHRWTFCIVNRPREIERIKQRSLRVLAPCDGYRELAEDLIPQTKGIHFFAYALSTNKGDLFDSEKRNIYRGKFRFDRELDEKRKAVWFEEIFVPRLMEE